MKTLYESLLNNAKGGLESLFKDLTGRGVVVVIDGVRLEADKLKAIKSFLKGTEHKSSLTLYFYPACKYMHVHRYVDMHKMQLSIVCKKTEDWPNASEWGKAVRNENLDDRMSVKDLLEVFDEMVEKIVKA